MNSITTKQSKILVLDDDVRIRKILGIQLEREGYQIDLAGTGEEVIEKLGKDNIYDLLIADIKLPGVNGKQVLKFAIENVPDMPVVMLTAVADFETVVSVMKGGAFDFLIKPIRYNELMASVKKAIAYGRLVKYNRRLELDNRKYQVELEVEVNERTKELSTALAQLRVVHMDTVRILSGAIEESDPYIRGHGNRVRHMAHHMADALGYSSQELDMLDFGALLHNIGKIAIDPRILNKPAALTPDERKIVETHPLVGERIVSKVSYFSQIVPVIRWHHERWDGNGYPDGLKGEDIPISARILTVVDSYDAMTSDRAYRLALPTNEAIDVLYQESGKQFDHDMVELFIREKTFELHFED